jgi:mRNA interferase HigB
LHRGLKYHQPFNMVVLSKSVLNKFFDKYPAASNSVLEWYGKTKDADWSDFAELKQTFPATDYVGNGLFVFNIGGNKYRLIARIIFSVRTVYIRFIGTHKEYDKVKLSGL